MKALCPPHIGRDAKLPQYSRGVRYRRSATRVFAVIQCTVLAGAGGRVTGEIHGDLELLKALQVQHDASVESIVTWKGSAVWQRSMVRGDNYEYSQTTEVDFALDQPGDRARWNQRTRLDRFLLDGREPSGPPPPEIGARNGMVMGNRFYRYEVPVAEEEWPTHTLVIQERRYAQGAESVFTFDPRLYLSKRVSGKMRSLYESAKDPKVGNWYVTRKGDLVTVEARFGLGGRSIKRYVFDLAKGANVVSEYMKGSGVDHRMTYEYEKIDGVWLPSSLMDRVVNISGGVKSVLTNQVKWSNSSVNRELGKGEFSLASLGVQPGDWIQDELAHLRFKYLGDAEDVELPIVRADNDIVAWGCV